MRKAWGMRSGGRHKEGEPQQSRADAIKRLGHRSQCQASVWLIHHYSAQELFSSTWMCAVCVWFCLWSCTNNAAVITAEVYKLHLAAAWCSLLQLGGTTLSTSTRTTLLEKLYDCSLADRKQREILSNSEIFADEETALCNFLIIDMTTETTPCKILLNFTLS